jgi:hypothetical protein
MFLRRKVNKLTQNMFRFDLLNQARGRIDKEGLNTLKYSLIKFLKHKLYTQILIEYNEKEILKNYC